MFESFAGLGLQASGGSLSLADFMKPGAIAGTGLDAADPLLAATEDRPGHPLRVILTHDLVLAPLGQTR